MPWKPFWSDLFTKTHCNNNKKEKRLRSFFNALYFLSIFISLDTFFNFTAWLTIVLFLELTEYETTKHLMGKHFSLCFFEKEARGLLRMRTRWAQTLNNGIESYKSNNQNLKRIIEK